MTSPRRRPFPLFAPSPSSFAAVAALLGAACGGNVEHETPDTAGHATSGASSSLSSLEGASTGTASVAAPPPPPLIFPPPSSTSSAIATAGVDAGVDAASSHASEGSSAEVDAGIDAPPPGLLAVPLTSCVPSQYTAAVTLGGTQTFEMAIDTGSTTLGVAAAKCSDCDVSPEYTPGASASDTHETGTSQYGTGSWSGEIYEDTVSVGGGPKAPVDFVAIDTQSDFFQQMQACDPASQSVTGILGLGPTGAALPGTNAFFDQFVATYHSPDVFATELCDGTGTLWLGGYDPTFTTAAPSYTPLSASFLSDYYYAVSFTSLEVAGVTVPVATEAYPDSVVDTGTSVFILPTAAFDAVTAALAADEGFQKVFGGSDAGASFLSNPEQCTTLTETKAELDAMLPPLTLVFGTSPSIEVRAVATESYLATYEGVWCPTLYSIASGPDFPLASIIGSPVLRSNVVIFDRAQGRVGFAPHTACD